MTKFPFYPLDKQNAYETYAAEFRFDQLEPTPWMPLRKDLKTCRMAILTTCGTRPKSDAPFPIDRTRGTAETREFSVFASPTELAFDDNSFPASEVKQDLNVLVPVEALISLTERRVLGELHETVTSFVGLCEDIDALKARAGQIGERLREVPVDVALVFTAGLACNQTAGLIARELERKGISTIVLVTLKEVAREVRIPRSVFINFPFGMVLGRAFAKSLQESIVNDIVHALKILDKPGRVYELPYKWEGPAE